MTTSHNYLWEAYPSSTMHKTLQSKSEVPIINFILPHFINNSAVIIYGLSGIFIFTEIFYSEKINLMILLLPFNFIFLAICLLPMSVLFAFIGEEYKPMRPFINYASLILYYITPVFIPKSIFNNPLLKMWNDINPAAAAIELIRAPVLDGIAPSMNNYLVMGSFFVITLTLALIFISKHEKF